MSAIESTLSDLPETNSRYYRLWAGAQRLRNVAWHPSWLPSPKLLQDGTIIRVNMREDGQVRQGVFLIKQVRRTINNSPVILVMGRELVTRDVLNTLVMDDEVSAAVAASVGSNELVDIGRHVVFPLGPIASVVSNITEFNCQTISLPTVYAAMPFYRNSIAFGPHVHADGTVRYAMRSVLSPVCTPECRLGRIVYSPDSQVTHWCRTCATWMHRACMNPALPKDCPRPVDTYRLTTAMLKKVWSLLAVAPIVRSPRPGLSPMSFETIIDDVQASGRNPPANIGAWLRERGYPFPRVWLGDWQYFVCPGCQSRI